MFGVFLFLTYYLQRTLGSSPLATGLVLLPMMAVIMITANVVNATVLPRTGPRPLIPSGMELTAIAMMLLTRIGVDSSYGTQVLPALLIMGTGMGLVFPPAMAMATATGGVLPQDAGPDRHRPAEHVLGRGRRRIPHLARAHAGERRRGSRSRLHNGVLVDDGVLPCRRSGERAPCCDSGPRISIPQRSPCRPTDTVAPCGCVCEHSRARWKPRA
jgi:hypothetical protein